MHIITILQWQLTYRITKEKFHGTICQNSDRFKVLCPFDSQVNFPLSFFQLKITNFTIGMKKKNKRLLEQLSTPPRHFFLCTSNRTLRPFGFEGKLEIFLTDL